MSNERVIAGYVDRIWRKYRAKRGVQTTGMNCKTRSNETLWLHLSRVSILPLAFLDFSGNYGIILILCGDVQDGKAVKVHIALELMLYFVWKFHRDPPRLEQASPQRCPAALRHSDERDGDGRVAGCLVRKPIQILPAPTFLCKFSRRRTPLRSSVSHSCSLFVFTNAKNSLSKVLVLSDFYTFISQLSHYFFQPAAVILIIF